MTVKDAVAVRCPVCKADAGHPCLSLAWGTNQRAIHPGRLAAWAPMAAAELHALRRQVARAPLTAVEFQALFDCRMAFDGLHMDELNIDHLDDPSPEQRATSKRMRAILRHADRALGKLRPS